MLQALTVFMSSGILFAEISEYCTEHNIKTTYSYNGETELYSISFGNTTDIEITRKAFPILNEISPKN